MNENNQTQEIIEIIVNTLRQEIICLDDALALISRGKDMAKTIGVPMVIAVADSGGNLIAQQRMDGALIGSIALSFSKAYTAAVLRCPTDELAASILPGQPLYGLAEAGGGHFCVFGGGIPIMKNGRCIGGLGVSGGTVAEDTEVASYALKSI